MCVYFKWRTVASSCHGDVHRSIGPHRRRAFKVNVRKGEWEAAGTPGGHWWTGSAWDGKLKQRRKTIYVVGGRGGMSPKNALCLLKLKYHSVFLSFFSSFELLSSDLINYFVWIFFASHQVATCFLFFFLSTWLHSVSSSEAALFFGLVHIHTYIFWVTTATQKKPETSKQRLNLSVIKPDCNVR